MTAIPKYTDAETAAGLVAELGQEFAMVENPKYIFPPYEAYPLAPRRTQLDEGLLGVVMDMDGTTTTTEPLCIHSLATMVRRITGHAEEPAWPGLNKSRDYPHIIGNSTTKHVEYLIRTYEREIKRDALCHFFVFAAAWTLGKAADEGRKLEVRSDMSALGLSDLVHEHRFEALQRSESLEGAEERRVVTQLAKEVTSHLRTDTFQNVVRAAIDIYYQRYHEILGRLAAGEGDTVAKSVFGNAGQRLVEPMPGISVFLAMLKGWLGEDSGRCFITLAEHLQGPHALSDAILERGRRLLPRLGAYFGRNPVHVGLVTSSIAYEANIVLGEVFRVLQGQIEAWDLPGEKRGWIREQFSDPNRYYDAFITASDSSEIRLKPHRDLYSLALHRLGLLPGQFHQVVGFEDSESGTIAIRAAGIPLCCALPFTLTQDHAFHAATHTCTGGIPEVILKHLAFLPETLLS